MSEEVKIKKPVYSNIPRKDSDLISLANRVIAVSDNYPGISLEWITLAKLKETISLFGTSYSERNETKGARLIITREFEMLNLEINESVGYVKGYIAEKYSRKEAPVHYSQFGFVKQGQTYKFPTDGDTRLHALDMMISAVELNGMGDNKFGKAYWETVRNRFEELRSKAIESDSAATLHASIKAEHRATIVKALNCVVYVIKANYPDTWKDVLRTCGFQKEKY